MIGLLRYRKPKSLTSEMITSPQLQSSNPLKRFAEVYKQSQDTLHDNIYQERLGSQNKERLEDSGYQAELLSRSGDSYPRLIFPSLQCQCR